MSARVPSGADGAYVKGIVFDFFFGHFPERPANLPHYGIRRTAG